MTETATPESLTERIATSVPARGIRLAYGEVQDIGGGSILPVAVVTYGFGASDQSDRWGVGGGGGGVAVPIGAYVGGSDEPRFRANPIAVLAMLAPLVAAIGAVLVMLRRNR